MPLIIKTKLTKLYQTITHTKLIERKCQNQLILVR